MKIEDVIEDFYIRVAKITTLSVQLVFEVISMLLLLWLQLQKYNVNNIMTGLTSNRTIEYLFIIPEKYECNLAQIRATTYFGFDWELYYGDNAKFESRSTTGIGQCNNGTVFQFVR